MDHGAPRSRLLAILCVLLAANLGVMSWLAWQHWQGHRDRFLEQAESHLVAGRPEAALRALSLHLEHHPGDREAEERRAALEVQYNQFLLADARRRLAADDRAGAVAAFKGYLARVPDDRKVQLELAKLYEKLGAEDEAELAYRRIVQGKARGADAAAVDQARHRLFRLVNERANGLKRRADALASQKKYEEALPLYDQVIALRARNPALDTATPDRTLAVRAFDAVVARRAFVAWQARLTEDPRSELASRHDAELAPGDRNPAAFRLEREEVRRSMLSDLFWEQGDRLFESEEWEGAIRAYRQASRFRPGQAAGGHDLDLAALEYNLAYSEFRAGRAQAALERLERLATEIPGYDRVNVNTLRQRIRESLKTEARAGGG